MAWVKFIHDYDFSPATMKGRATTAYKAGMVQNVTRECAEKAIAAGKAEEARISKAKDAGHGDA